MFEFEVRAYPKALPEAERTPDKYVYGQHFQSANKRHYIILNTNHRVYNGTVIVCIEQGPWMLEFIEIDPSTLGVKTGKKDKNGKDIYGSVPEKGFMGGDTLYCKESKRKLTVMWSKESAAWYTQNAYDDEEQEWLRIWATETFEIIPTAEKEGE